jgi:uncharacterized membrane protein YcaP (DUF421 family)
MGCKPVVGSWDPYHLSIIAAKTAIILLFTAGLYRLLGKRYTTQMNVYDLVTVVAVANALQNGMTEGSGDLFVGMVSALALLGMAWLIGRTFIRAPKLRDKLVGTPTLLIYNGKLVKDKIRKEGVSREEIDTVLREHGMDSHHACGMAVLEVDGSISVIPAGRSCKF